MTKERKECRRLFCGPSMTSTIALFQCQLLKLCDYRVQMRAGDREQLFDVRIRTGRSSVKHYQTVCTRMHVYTHHRYTSLRLWYTSLSSGEPLFFCKSPNAVTCTYAIRNKKTWAACFYFFFFFPQAWRGNLVPTAVLMMSALEWQAIQHWLSGLIHTSETHLWLRKILREKIIYCHELDRPLYLWMIHLTLPMWSGLLNCFFSIYFTFLKKINATQTCSLILPTQTEHF